MLLWGLSPDRIVVVSPHGETTHLLGTYPSHVYSFLRGNHGIVDHMKSLILPWVVITLSIGCVFIAAQSIQIPSNPIIAIPNTSQSIDFHTPVVENDLTLPLHISTNTTVGPTSGIILINNLVTIDKDASLTILPGTTLAVREFGGLNVLGKLHAIGTKDNPITFITNELNETNRHWVGILLQNSSTAELDNISIHHASPAISCSPQAHASIQRITFLLDAVGYARNTVGCTIN